MTWRDGVHITGTPIWCDARRRRDACFASSADRVGRTGHGQLIATPTTLALLGIAATKGAGGDLSAPLNKRFTLGTLRLELIPSGRGLGTAALYVDTGPRTVLYAGEIGATADVRTADVIVVAAPYGDTQRFAPVEGAVVAWTRAQLAAGKRPVLVVDHLIDALELAGWLAAADIAIAASRATVAAATRARKLVAVPEIAAIGRARSAVIQLATERIQLPEHAVTALVSGRALAGSRGFAAAFAWTFSAGRDELLEWIASTHAKQVYVTGAGADAIVAAVGSRGRSLGPPRQMALFEAS